MSFTDVFKAICGSALQETNTCHRLVPFLHATKLYSPNSSQISLKIKVVYSERNCFCCVTGQVRHLIHNQLKADIEEKLTALSEFRKADVSSSIPFCNACYKSVYIHYDFKEHGIVSNKRMTVYSSAREQNIGHPLAMLVLLLGSGRRGWTS